MLRMLPRGRQPLGKVRILVTVHSTVPLVLRGGVTNYRFLNHIAPFGTSVIGFHLPRAKALVCAEYNP